MKKRLLFACALVLMTGLVTGCKKDDIKLDLDNVEKEIANLKGSEFDRFAAEEIIKGDKENLEGVFSYDFKKTLKLSLTDEDLEEYSVGYDKKSKESYFLVKPMEGKEEDVKKAIDEYYSNNKITDYTYEKVGSYLIYINTDNAKDVIKDVKNAKTTVFGSLLKLDNTLLKDQIGIDEEDVSEYLVMLPEVITSSSSYVIVKPVKGKEKTVKEKLDKYMNDQEEMWKLYLEDQYELVKNRAFEEYGDYLIYVISPDNDLVLSTIKK